MRPRIHESDQKRYSEPTCEKPRATRCEVDEFDHSAGKALFCVNSSAPRTPACGFRSVAALEPRSRGFFDDVRARQHGARRAWAWVLVQVALPTRPPSREPNARLDDGSRPSSAQLT